MKTFTPRATFGVTPISPEPPDANKELNTQKTVGFTRKEVGAIWSNISKATGEEFLKIHMTLPKGLVESALASSTGETVDFGLISFANKTQNGDNSRPKFRIFEDKKR